MPSRFYKSEGIVLARRDYGEADRILILFTRDFGKVPVIAKGVKKLGSKKRGHLEIFSLIKFSASKTKGLDIITEAQVINNFPSIRVSLKKVSVAYYFMEVIGRVTREGEKNEQLFELIFNYLRKLGKSNSLSKLRKDFVREVLINLGFWPKEKEMFNSDQVLEEIVERKINSLRVGKRVLS